MINGDDPTVSQKQLMNVHTEEGAHVNLDKDGFFIALGIRNYLSNSYKDPMSTTREATALGDDSKGKAYSYGSWTDPTGPNPWVKWEAAVFEGDGATSKILQTVGMHVCTEFEWAAGFNKPATKDKTKVD